VVGVAPRILMLHRGETADILKKNEAWLDEAQKVEVVADHLVTRVIGPTPPSG